MAKSKGKKETDKPEDGEVIRQVQDLKAAKTNKERKTAQLKPLVGDMVIIMGVPKENDYNARTIIPAIAEVVNNAYDAIDVVKIKNVDLHAPAIFANREGDQEMIDYVNTGEGKALMALYIHQDRQKREEGEAEDLKHFEQMSPESQRSLIEHVRQLRKEANGAAEKRRLEAVEHAFEVAQKWSTGVDLTPRERVHGAVGELYGRYGETRGVDSAGRPLQVDPSRDYQKHFDTHFADDIKARSIRAAKDLFGQK